LKLYTLFFNDSLEIKQQNTEGPLSNAAFHYFSQIETN
jgi:hypothetical protein